jgi:hypothetical protein
MFCALVLSPVISSAATILTNPSQFTSANIIVQFEVFPDGQPLVASSELSDQWRSLGLLIADNSPENGASVYTSTGFVPPHSSMWALGPSRPDNIGGFVEFRFVIPNTSTFGVVEEVGLWAQNGDDSFPPFPANPSTVTFFDINGAVLGAATTSLDDEFIGIRAPEGVARIRVTDNSVFTVDDIQFSPVPEPAGLRLILAVASILAMRGSTPTYHAARSARRCGGCA